MTTIQTVNFLNLSAYETNPPPFELHSNAVQGVNNTPLEDTRIIEPLDLMDEEIHESDPLALTNSQLFMFASASLCWVSSLALTSKWVTEEQANTVEWIAHLTSVAANYAHLKSFFKKSQLSPTQSSKFSFITQNPCFKFLQKYGDKSWHTVGAWAASIGCGVMPLVPLLTLGYQSWNTLNIGKSALEGLKSTQQNFKHRPIKASRNAVVHLTNPAYSAYKVFDAYKKWQLSIPILLSWWAARSQANQT